MANARELRKRRKSAQNTRKITSTMELVASAKLKKAQDAAEASRPYAEGLAELVSKLASVGGDDAHPLMEQREVKRVVVVVCASDRGLCGAFNANLIHEAVRVIRAHRQAGREVEVVSAGKKAVSSLRFLGFGASTEYNGIMDAPKYPQAQTVIEPLMERFTKREIDQVDVVYARFISAGRINPDCRQLLPAGGTDVEAGGSAGGGDFIFHPSAEAILTELIPQTVKTALFSCFLQTSAGEHAARRSAMKNATDAAGDLIKFLTRSYNRARQGKITQEIAEIVGAVEAMS